jgi:hypothetical protein
MDSNGRMNVPVAQTRFVVLRFFARGVELTRGLKAAESKGDPALQPRVCPHCFRATTSWFNPTRNLS